MTERNFQEETEAGAGNPQHNQPQMFPLPGKLDWNQQRGAEETSREGSQSCLPNQGID